MKMGKWKGGEFGEHLTRDQTLFLHTESLQMLQIHKFTLVLHPTHIGFGSGDWDGHGRSFILCSVTQCFWFVCIGLFSWWKVQPRPVIRFIAERSGFDFLSVGIW